MQAPIGWSMNEHTRTAEFDIGVGTLPEIRRYIDNAQEYLKDTNVYVKFFAADDDAEDDEDKELLGTMKRTDEGWELDAQSDDALSAYNGNLLCCVSCFCDEQYGEYLKVEII